MMEGMGTFGWGPGFGWVFMILMILFWGVIILGIVALVKWLSTGTNRPRPAKTAFEILEERYARGEIEQEEFEQKKRDLES